MSKIMIRKAVTMENDNDSKLTWLSMRKQLVELKRIANQNNKHIFNSKSEFTNTLFKLRSIANLENMKLIEIKQIIKRVSARQKLGKVKLRNRVIGET